MPVGAAIVIGVAGITERSIASKKKSQADARSTALANQADRTSMTDANDRARQEDEREERLLAAQQRRDEIADAEDRRRYDATQARQDRLDALDAEDRTFLRAQYNQTGRSRERDPNQDAYDAQYAQQAAIDAKNKAAKNAAALAARAKAQQTLGDLLNQRTPGYNGTSAQPGIGSAIGGAQAPVGPVGAGVAVSPYGAAAPPPGVGVGVSGTTYAPGTMPTLTGSGVFDIDEYLRRLQNPTGKRIDQSGGIGMGYA